MCNGGCINGAGVFSTPTFSRTAFLKESKTSTIKNVADNSACTSAETIDMER